MSDHPRRFDSMSSRSSRPGDRRFFASARESRGTTGFFPPKSHRGGVPGERRTLTPRRSRRNWRLARGTSLLARPLEGAFGNSRVGPLTASRTSLAMTELPVVPGPTIRGRPRRLREGEGLRRASGPSALSTRARWLAGFASPPTGETARARSRWATARRGDERAMSRSITVPDAIRPAPPPGGIGGEDQGRRPSRCHQPKGLP